MVASPKKLSNKTMLEEDGSEFVFQIQLRKDDNRNASNIAQLLKSIGCVVCTKSSDKGLFWVLFETVEKSSFNDLDAAEFR